MKKLIKLLPILLLILVTSCDTDDESARFSNDPTTGWIEFNTSGETISIITDELLVPVSVRVPVFRDGITISYALEAVEGDFNSVVTTGSNVTLGASQANADGSPFVVAIPLTFTGVSDLDEIVVFDVVLTATDINGVSIGLDGGDSFTRYRISTPCPLDVSAIEGTYDVDEVFTSGLNEGLSFAGAFGQSYQIEIALDPNDPTQTNFIVTNSEGFDPYFTGGTVATLDTCNGTVSFETPNRLADFADFTLTSSSYTETPAVITADGTAGNFGPYQFVLTKQ